MASETIAFGVARNNACQRFSTSRRSMGPRAYSFPRPPKPTSLNAPAQVPSTGAPSSTSRAGGAGSVRGFATGVSRASAAMPGMFPIRRRSATRQSGHLSSCLRGARAAMLPGHAPLGEQRRRCGGRRPARAGGGAVAARRSDGSRPRPRAKRVEPQHLAAPATADQGALPLGRRAPLRGRRDADGRRLRGSEPSAPRPPSGRGGARHQPGREPGPGRPLLGDGGDGDPDFAPAAAFAGKLAAEVARRGLPPGTLLNVNVPPGEPRGTRITRIGKRSYSAAVGKKVDPRGRAYYWIGGDEQAHENVPGSDCDAVFDRGLISVTPLHLDLTLHALLEELKEWDLPGLSS